MFGLGLATAVFLDATVVRMVIVPAVMTLFGDKAWQLPRWLDRILPNLDVAGEQLVDRLEAHDAEVADRRLPSEAAPAPQAARVLAPAYLGSAARHPGAPPPDGRRDRPRPLRRQPTPPTTP